MRFLRSRVVMAFGIVLGAAGAARAQHAGHGGVPSTTTDGSAGLASARIGDLLKIADASVRGMERAIAHSDPELLGDSIAGYLSTVDTLMSAFDFDPAGVSSKELGRAEKVFGRHEQRLQGLSAKSPEYREALDGAYDAARRARDAAASAREDALARGPSPVAGHHGRATRGGCGHN